MLKLKEQGTKKGTENEPERMYMKTKVENMWGIVRRKCKLVQ
jgi:hypothetical protein